MIVPGMRVEWAKSHARAQRWAEEVVLLTEEMRRIIVFLDWKAAWWRDQAERRQDVQPDVALGLAAYAYRQGDLMENIARSFASLWYPILTAAHLPSDWPAQYVSHAQHHPTTVRPARHRKKAQPATGAIESEPEDDDEVSEDSDGLSEDDADVSPYR